jgi:hypothetical protein
MLSVLWTKGEMNKNHFQNGFEEKTLQTDQKAMPLPSINHSGVNMWYGHRWRTICTCHKLLLGVYIHQDYAF